MTAGQLGGLSVGEWLTLISAVTAAVVAIIGARRTGAVKSDVAGVKTDVAGVKTDIATYNGAPIGELAAADETRRIEGIAPADRTRAEALHIAQVPFQTPPPPKGS